MFALSLKLDGREVGPTHGNIASGAYPMSRPLFLLANGAPTGDALTMVELLLGARGQALVKKHGYLTLAELKNPEAARDAGR